MNSANFLLGNATGGDPSPEWRENVCRCGLSRKNLTSPLHAESLMEADRVLRRRILLVEDEGLVRELIGRLLARDEHAVVEANNGAEAFSLFTRNRFDLVMTDFEIPFMKGNELAARIKQLAPSQPILMITAYGKRPGPDNPVDAVLNKPVDLDHLRTAIARLLPEEVESLTA
jgi:CheY-like chemotaxis protein